MTEAEVQKIIFDALESLNEELDQASRVTINSETKLFGADAALDSLSLVSVIVDVETNISAALGHSIALTDDRAMSQEVSPFSDVQALTKYIVQLAAEKV